MAKTVKIAKIPGGVKEVALEDGATIGDALNVYAETFGESITGYEVRLGTGIATMSEVPMDGSKIYLALQVKGNA